jgi:hypothetical protein
MKKKITDEQVKKIVEALQDVMSGFPAHYTDAEQARAIGIPVVILLAMKQILRYFKTH